jgi:dipeptidyl-peptidase-4
MGLIRHPELFRCGVARDPVTDWTKLPPASAERYLGSHADNADIYEHHSVTPPATLLISPHGDLSAELTYVTRECG